MAPQPPAEPDPRRRRLRRMQALANGLAAAMAALLVVAGVLARRWEPFAYVRAFAEAALVGACADAFAVSALFRRPLGLPIPHTAIIPRNQARIGEALGRFIVDNFLSPRVLDARLRQLELARWGGAWLQAPPNAARVAERLVAWGPALWRALPAGALEALAGSAALAAARATPAAPAASALLAALWSEGRMEPLIDRGAALLGGYLDSHQDVILEKVQAQSWRWLPTWVDRAIARRITGGLVQLLADVRSPEHPWRVRLAREVEGLIARLATDPGLQAQGEALKRQALDDPRLRAHAHQLWVEIQRQLQAPAGPAGEAELRARLERLVVDLGGWLRDDAAVQRTLAAASRAFVRGVLAPRREAVGRFVAQVVEGWDARSVVERLELQVGPDLQYIRVNGTVVGGLVGLALYTAARLAGLA